MGKKTIALLIVTIMCCTLIFTACNKDKYTDPSTGGEFVLVTDENGGRVLSEDGELVVYATDEDGKKIKDDDGNYVTEIHGFVGQIESDGVVEDYAYYFTLPSGWKTVNDRGEFEKKSKKYTMHININEKTFNDYYAKTKQFGDAVSKEDFNTTNELGWQGEWHEFDYDNADTKVYLLMLK